jgi:hypothetical protein
MRQIRDDLVADRPVHPEVVLAAEQVVPDAGGLRNFGVERVAGLLLSHANILR